VLTGRTRVAAVIGDPVAHSLSPAIHNAAFAATALDWVFVALRVPDGEVGRALAGVRAMGLAGLSVTMPHKAAVVPHLDELSDDALALDAVNCVVRDGDRLRGVNTDGDGFLDALGSEGVDVGGRRVLVLGAGGAGRAVVRSLARAGATEIGVVNRSPERRLQAVELGAPVARAADAAEAPRFDVLVNATSVGMGTSEPALDPGLLRPAQAVVDLVYEPVQTALLAAARAVGATPVDGVGMLVHQAAHAFTRWTGVPAPVEVMTVAARAALT
jgi:shikimate dehydrogenase